MQEDGTLPVAVEADFDHFIAARRDLLAARLAAVDRKARGGLLPQVTLGDLIPVEKRLRQRWSGCGREPPSVASRPVAAFPDASPESGRAAFGRTMPPSTSLEGSQLRPLARPERTSTCHPFYSRFPPNRP